MSEPLPTRYPGLSSFTTAQKDIFFGRTQETFDLFNFISLERMVVLFSKSGYGKTSLLQAGLIPLLYDHRMTPVLIRFGTDKANPEWHFKSQFEETYFRFMGVDARAEAALAENETFWAQIRRCPFVNGDDRFTPLFIFDQFEELFTLYPDQQRRQRFITELADLIQGQLPESLHEEILLRLISRDISDQEAAEMEQVPPMKFIFSIRSDMLHFLDELSKPIPRILDARYQLFGLSEQQAEDAIVEPAKLGTETIAQMNGSSMPLRFLSPPFGFEPSAKTEILSTLIKNDEVESF
ncbi:MAG: hypothetical protein ABIQ93_13210, partial [Saprospiraceae bacterium]